MRCPVTDIQLGDTSKKTIKKAMKFSAMKTTMKEMKPSAMKTPMKAMKPSAMKIATMKVINLKGGTQLTQIKGTVMFQEDHSLEQQCNKSFFMCAWAGPSTSQNSCAVESG